MVKSLVKLTGICLQFLRFQCLHSGRFRRLGSGNSRLYNGKSERALLYHWLLEWNLHPKPGHSWIYSASWQEFAREILVGNQCVSYDLQNKIWNL